MSKSISEGNLDLEGLAELPDPEVIERICGFAGIGSGTAEYVMLRGLGRTRLFSGGVAGVRTNLQRYLHQANPSPRRQPAVLWTTGTRMAD